jgi:hypothetical protein
VGLWFVASEAMALPWRAGFASGVVDGVFCAEALAKIMHPITAVTNGQTNRTRRRRFRNRNLFMVANCLYDQSPC